MHVPSGWLMPFTMVVVRIQAVTYDILGSVIWILAQMKVCQAVLTDRAVVGSQGHEGTSNPSEPFTCVPE